MTTTMTTTATTTTAAIYSVGLLRDFVARHRLVGGDWGRENLPHAHHYRMEAVFQGEHLDRHGYLIDISLVEPRLDSLVERYRDQMLNDLPEFTGENPALERFAAILADRLAQDLPPSNVSALLIKLWESDGAYATCHRRLG